MATTYTRKAGQLVDEMAAVGLSSAADLARESGIARNTASALMRGARMTLPTAVKVVQALNRLRGTEAHLDKDGLKVSHLFDQSGDTRDELSKS